MWACFFLKLKVLLANFDNERIRELGHKAKYYLAIEIVRDAGIKERKNKSLRKKIIILQNSQQTKKRDTYKTP